MYKYIIDTIYTCNFTQLCRSPAVVDVHIVRNCRDNGGGAHPENSGYYIITVFIQACNLGLHLLAIIVLKIIEPT